ncbi:SAC3/GANP/Nin1/mts3/eIF-3 p25 family-domain-containing protein [Naematelia encephala]|uniref:SAC3/GANP/Nin1/mts3/eIF-3 p25 family-domain-containing protein n=1 Tax=Naematelia encephala TaxID=71784 RepID=A0A1Y2BL99_9TREE|nr:SAC3/GANP/Nin1/mts3/eIF-3 p25 family-domain-containing protein [Naematelia encephala]
MPPREDALASSGLDSDDEFARPDRKTARAARFGKPVAPGSKFKHLDDARQAERQAYEERGLITSGKTELENAVDLQGTCERMCSRHEYDTRIIRHGHSPFELGPDGKFDYDKAVAAYTRSDAGAGMGSAAILPSDMRTPAALVRSLDYLFHEIMTQQPSNLTGEPSQRKALGASAGFIRDRTRAIRKEFAMQSSWGHEENIESLERIARWHILCLRELQEQSGYNQDMHIDSAELGRCFTSLRQQYNDRREELGIDMPSPNEPEFVAYSLIYNLADRSVSIPAGELPSGILDHPLVQLAWDIRNAAQRNFDTQKDSSRGNAELGANIITRFTRLLKQSRLPFLMSCLVEIRLRDMRRSALRSMVRAYPKLRDGVPVRYGENGEVVERRMMLMPTLERILGCEEQENEEPAYDDVEPVPRDPADEAAKAVTYHNIELWPEDGPPQGALINQGADFEDNRDGLFVRRWKIITDKRTGLSFPDIVDGKTGIDIAGAPHLKPIAKPIKVKSQPTPSFTFAAPSAVAKPALTKTPDSIIPPKPTTPFSFNIKPSPTPTAIQPPAPPAAPSTEIPNFFSSVAKSTATPATLPKTSPQPIPKAATADTAVQPTFSFDFGKATPPTTTVVPSITTIPSTTPQTAAPPSTLPLFSKPGFFAASAEAGPSKPIDAPSLPLSTAAAIPANVPPEVIQVPAEPSQSKRLLKKPSLSASLSRSTSRKADVVDVYRHNLGPAITDRIMQEVIASMLNQVTPEINRVYKQTLAAQAYAEAKVRRQETIVRCTQETFDIMRDELVRSIATDVIAKEYRRRRVTKRIFHRWLDYVKRMKGKRAELEREREETFERLKGMGLGGNVMGDLDDGEDLDMAASQGGAVQEYMDEFEADVVLRQAEQQKDHFYSPSTFLHQIARHVAALYSPVTPTATSTFSLEHHAAVAPNFHTLLSISTQSATPPDKDAQDWLISKFMPKDEEKYVLEDIGFPVDVVDRYEEPPVSTYYGLCVLETPMTTWDSGKRAENTADVQDRIEALIKVSEQMENQFVPALLILSWEGETLDEIIDRLEIEDDVEAFEHVAVLSLEYSEDLDAQFDDTLKALMPELQQKHQVVIRLQDLVSRVSLTWQRYIDVAALALSSRPTSAALALQIFSRGVDLINALPVIARSSVGRVKLSIASTFNPIKLPAFEASAVNSVDESAEAIIGYLSQDVFADLDDAQLAIAPLRQGAASQQALPIIPILQSLAFLVFGEIRTQVMPLKSWWPDPEGPRDIVSGYLASAESAYTSRIEESIKIITREMSSPLQEQPANTPQPQESPSPFLKQSKISTPPPPTKASQGVKRSRQSFNTPPTSESKAAKNARLLRVLASATKTMEAFDTSDGWSAIDPVN